MWINSRRGARCERYCFMSSLFVFPRHTTRSVAWGEPCKSLVAGGHQRLASRLTDGRRLREARGLYNPPPLVVKAQVVAETRILGQQARVQTLCRRLDMLGSDLCPPRGLLRWSFE